MIDQEIFKIHIYVDHNLDDRIIELHLDAAIKYIKDMTGIDNVIDTAPDYELAVYQLAAHYYANREATTELKLSELPYGTRNFIMRNRQVADYF